MQKKTNRGSRRVISIRTMYLFAVVAFDGDGGDVFPAELSDHLDQSLGLEVVGRDDAAKVLESRLVRQFGAGRSVADLRYLPEGKKVHKLTSTVLRNSLVNGAVTSPSGSSFLSPPTNTMRLRFEGSFPSSAILTSSSSPSSSLATWEGCESLVVSLVWDNSSRKKKSLDLLRANCFFLFFFFFGDLSSHPIISNGMRAAGSSSTPLDTPTQGAAIN